MWAVAVHGSTHYFRMWIGRDEQDAKQRFLAGSAATCLNTLQHISHKRIGDGDLTDRLILLLALIEHADADLAFRAACASYMQILEGAAFFIGPLREGNWESSTTTKVINNPKRVTAEELSAREWTKIKPAIVRLRQELFGGK